MILRVSKKILAWLAALLALASCHSKTNDASPSSSASPVVDTNETVRVAIGTQDTTINCATGGPLVRELHLLEKYLPRTGKYQDVTYDIKWENQPTGAQHQHGKREPCPQTETPAAVGCAATHGATSRMLAGSGVTMCSRVVANASTFACAVYMLCSVCS